MLKKFIHRYLPERKILREHKLLRMFGKRLQDENLWHINRRSISGGVAVGLFSAYIPIPFEMVLAAFLAIVLRVNLPLSVALVWISNPLTWIPLYGTAYLLGAWILGESLVPFEVMNLAWLRSNLLAMWLGCLILGPTLAGIGFVTVRLIWRTAVMRRWDRRRTRRRLAAEARADKAGPV